MTTALRSELEQSPDRVFRDQIQRGDVIQMWEPVMVETGDWPPYTQSPDGAMRLTCTRTAHTRDSDLAGRWSDADGYLVHGEHGGYRDATEDVPGYSGFEVLIRVHCGADQ